MRLPTFAIVVLTAALAPSLAAAQASVQFRLTDSAGRPVDGRVTMAGQPGTLACSTTASRCTLAAPAGSYTVTVAPMRESAPAPRTVTVPASGALSVALTMRAAAATAVVSGANIRPAVRTPITTPVAGGIRPVTPTSTATPTATATRITTSGTVYSTGVSSGRPLGTGRTLAVQGSVMDSAGRPVDATITVSNAGGVVGTVTSTAGRFSMYDLPPGAYSFAALSTRRTSSTLSVSVGTATVSRVTVRVP